MSSCVGSLTGGFEGSFVAGNQVVLWTVLGVNLGMVIASFAASFQGLHRL
jgi:hypothetical protein